MPQHSTSAAGSHISRNLGRYGKGAAAVLGGAVLAKPIGRALGGRNVDRRDPHYDMNYRSGRSQFHKRRRSFDEDDLMEPGAHVMIPAAAGAAGGGVLLKRARSGYDEGKFKARQKGVQAGYEDEYRRYYRGRRRESLREKRERGDAWKELNPYKAGDRFKVAGPIGVIQGPKITVRRTSVPKNVDSHLNRWREEFDEDLREISIAGGLASAIRRVRLSPRAARIKRAQGPKPPAAPGGRRGPRLGLGWKTKVGLGAAGLAAGVAAYKGTKEAYKKVTEDYDPFLEDDLAEIAATGHVLNTARRMGPAVKWGSRGLIGADVAMLGHTVARDRKEKKTPIHKVKESTASSARRVAASGVPMIDKALVSTSIGGSIYTKTKDYQDRRLLKKVTGGRIDRSKE